MRFRLHVPWYWNSCVVKHMIDPSSVIMAYIITLLTQSNLETKNLCYLIFYIDFGRNIILIVKVIVLIFIYRSMTVVGGAFFREASNYRELILWATSSILACCINLKFKICVLIIERIIYMQFYYLKFKILQNRASILKNTCSIGWFISSNISGSARPSFIILE